MPPDFTSEVDNNKCPM